MMDAKMPVEVKPFYTIEDIQKIYQCGKSRAYAILRGIDDMASKMTISRRPYKISYAQLKMYMAMY